MQPLRLKALCSSNELPPSRALYRFLDALFFAPYFANVPITNLREGVKGAGTDTH
jgi:hypothetical protein